MDFYFKGLRGNPLHDLRVNLTSQNTVSSPPSLKHHHAQHTISITFPSYSSVCGLTPLTLPTPCTNHVACEFWNYVCIFKNLSLLTWYLFYVPKKYKLPNSGMYVNGV